nr:dihydroorotase [Synergistales bacterium]
NTEPAIDSAPLVDFVARKGTQLRGARVLPSGCVTRERKGQLIAELGKMAEAGAVFFTDDGSPVSTSQILKTALYYTRDLGVRIMEHPEETSLTSGGQVNEGLASSVSGLKGVPASAEYIDVARGIALSRDTGSPIHFTHVSTALAMDAIRMAKKEGLHVTCDVTAHHLSLDENHVLVSKFDSLYKVNPPLRSKADVKALWEALGDGTVDALITDHAPWHNDEKDLPFQEAPFGIASLECSVAVIFDTWLKLGRPVSLERMLQLFTSGPASLLPERWRHLGRIEEDSVADLTLLDLDESRNVDVSSWKSKGRNCPWRGEILTGWPVMSIVRGSVFQKEI